jgi:hypothetical protein
MKPTRPRVAPLLRQRGRARGAAMTETVLVAPFLLLFLALVLFFGRMMVQAQHTQVAARYETWREMTGAPGPAPDDNVNPEHRNWQINDLFFARKASTLNDFVSNGAFPSLQAPGTSTHERVVGAAIEESDEAAAFASALMYEPQGDPLRPRFSHGRQVGFSARRDVFVPALRPYVGGIRRVEGRIGSAWPFTGDWRAGPDLWQSSGRIAPHHARALRDEHLADFDARLDSVDGNATPEYPGDDTERTRTQALAGFIRSLYLHDPGYRGPIVSDENP